MPDFWPSDFQRALKIIIIAELFIVMTISPGLLKHNNSDNAENAHSRSYVRKLILTIQLCKKCINNDVGDEKHYILYCNVPEIVDLRVEFLKGNKLTRVSGENAKPFTEDILSISLGTPHLIGKFLHGVIEFLKEK